MLVRGLSERKWVLGKLSEFKTMTGILSECDLRACAGTLGDLYGETSLHELPGRLLPLVKGLIPCEYLSYDDFDDRQQRYFVHTHPTRATFDPLMPQLGANHSINASFERFRRTSPIPVKVPHVATTRQFKETAAYQEFYRALGVKDQMILMLDGDENARVGLSLNRSHLDFSERDRDVLVYLSTHIVQAYQNARSNAVMAAHLEHVGEGLASMNRALILAGKDGHVRWLSALAHECLQDFFPDFRPMSDRLPLRLRQWLDKTDTSPGPAGRRSSEMQILAANGHRLSVYCGNSRSGDFTIALVRERGSIDLATAQRFNLTPREAEVLMWVSEAKSNPEIGLILSISPRTVDKHIEHLFSKLGVENRMEAQRLGMEMRRI
jgi:DNA-binding CsgD family transcriptional regulator